MGKTVADVVAEIQHKSRQEKDISFDPVLSELREKVRERDPEVIAAVSGASWDAEAGAFQIQYFGDGFRITWPALVAYPAGGDAPCPTYLQGLFLYYLSMADGTPPAGRWIAFRELPDGWLYAQAFQGYTGDELVRAIGDDLGALAEGAKRCGGRPQDVGDAGYAFEALPRVRVAVVYWRGDDEFSPNAQMLFDAAAGHYLPTDGLAVLGHHLIHDLLETA